MKKVLNKKLVFILILIISIGFAYLVTDLYLDGYSLIFANRWDVHFENIVVSEGSIEASEPVISQDATQVTFSVELDMPGDYYEFTVDAVNDGTIDAMIDTYTMTELTQEQQKYLEYIVTYDNDEEIEQNQELDAGLACTYKIIIKYKNDIEIEDLPEENKSITLSLTVNYIQADENSRKRNSEYLLYNVLKNRAKYNNLAREYTGNHNDSLDPSLSTEKIYHWYGSNDTEGTSIPQKNNVVFANHCWKILRTTDTGGVKIMYNGIATNNKCENNNNVQIGYNRSTTINMEGDYWYGSNYLYNSETQQFTVSGTTTKKTWNNTNSNEVIGKYTCKSENLNDGCVKIYKIIGYSSSALAEVIPIQNIGNNPKIGDTHFNSNGGSPKDVGYKYGDTYASNSYSFYNKNLTEYKSINNLKTASYAKNTYWYSDSITYDNTSGKYSLDNPKILNSTNEFSKLEGNYTFFSTSETFTGTVVHYVTKINSNLQILIELKNGNYMTNYNNNYYYGDSYTDNGDNTYTINSANTIETKNWSKNYNNVNGKYLCENTSTCSDIKYVYSSSETSYNYIDAKDEKVLIAKSRNKNQLSNTILVNKATLMTNYNDYSDYKYTCNTTESVCSDKVYSIISFNNRGYENVPTYFYGTNVSWNNNKYVLNNPIELNSLNKDTLISTNRYICLNQDTECEEVAYIRAYNSSIVYYIILNENDLSIDDIFNNMFRKNSNDSIIKIIIDDWYRNNLIDYTSYIEDTIYCNDRTIQTKGAWDPNTNNLSIQNYLKFKGSLATSTDLYCNNETDRFSINNNNATLDYPIGLPTLEEIKIMNKYNERNYGYIWLGNAGGYGFNDSDGYTIAAYGLVASTYNSNIYQRQIGYPTVANIRPVISLKSGTTFITGNGSNLNPYIIDTE